MQVALVEQSKELERAAETIEELHGWKEGLEETVDNINVQLVVAAKAAKEMEAAHATSIAELDKVSGHTKVNI